MGLNKSCNPCGVIREGAVGILKETNETLPGSEVTQVAAGIGSSGLSGFCAP